MRNVDLSALAGQVLVVGFQGADAPPWVIARAKSGRLAGFILFKRNVVDAAQTHALLRELAELFETPPVLAVDQEGGRVARLGTPVLPLPPMRQLGGLDDPALTRRAGMILGRQLHALGFTCNFAPVLDIDTNPENPVIGDRSFGRSPAVVARHGIAFGAGLQSAGVLACGKHFPGHGDTTVDSHLALPRVRHPRSRLDEIELAPFRAAAPYLDSLMTAHVVFDELDPGVPATLSRAIIHDLLRHEMGYRGLVFSDDLEMKAVKDTVGVGAAAVRAIEAGCDALLICSRREDIEEAEEALVLRAEREPRFRERLAVAGTRTTAIRRRYCAQPRPSGAEEVERLLRDEGRSLIAALR